METREQRITRWKQELANGELSQASFDLLMAGEKELIEMEQLRKDAQ